MLFNRTRLPRGVDSGTSGRGKGGGESLVDSRRSFVMRERLLVAAEATMTEADGRTDFRFRMSNAFDGKRFC